MMLRVSIVVVLVSAVGVTAAPVTLQVNTAQSSVGVEMCASFEDYGDCDSDSSPVAGDAAISLDCLDDPASFTLHDFDFLLTQNIDLYLEFRFFVVLGTFSATGRNMELMYEMPGWPMPPTPLSGSPPAFGYSAVPVDAAGSLTYNATGIVCVAMGAVDPPMPCSDAMDLATLSLDPAAMNGTVDVSGRDITLTIDIDTIAPINPDDPSMGEIAIAGTIVAEGAVQPPDVETFVGILLGDLTGDADTWDADMNGDCMVNGLDVQWYVDDLLG